MNRIVMMACVVMAVISPAIAVEFMFEESCEEPGSICITGVVGTAPAKLVIPAKYDGRIVYSVCGNSFKKDTTITTLIVESGVREISGEAFCNASCLTSVTLNEGLEIIGRLLLLCCENDDEEGRAFRGRGLYSGYALMSAYCLKTWR